MSDDRKVSTWRIILASILDFFTAFFASGLLVAYFTGGMTENGFSLNGFPALACFALVILYFWLFPKFFGGRIWQSILGAVRK